jgi:hypothetical protein
MMRTIRLKSLIISVCCLVVSAWTEVQGADEEKDLAVARSDYGQRRHLEAGAISQVLGHEDIAAFNYREAFKEASAAQVGEDPPPPYERPQNFVPQNNLEYIQQLELEREADKRRIKELEKLINSSQKKAPLLAEEAEEKDPIARIPSPIAQEHEVIYQKFLKGILVYRPDLGSDKGSIKMPIRDIANPETLEGTFNLSGCGDIGQYLSISTGYRKEKKAENANKLEIWLTPRFLSNKWQFLDNIPWYLKNNPPEFLSNKWDAAVDVGIFWSWGAWDDLSLFYYLVTKPFDVLFSSNLYEKWGERRENVSFFARGDLVSYILAVEGHALQMRHLRLEYGQGANPADLSQDLYRYGVH